MDLSKTPGVSHRGERDLNERVLQKVHRAKAAKSNRCRAHGRSMARQRGLPPFFPSGAFPEEPRAAFFIHISMVVTRSSKAATPRCRNRFRMAHHARPSSASFSRHGCSPRSGLHLCTVPLRIFMYVPFFLVAMLHFIKTFRYVINAQSVEEYILRLTQQGIAALHYN